MFPIDFTLINIGKINQAAIKLNKFTVLCGKNGIGKSFFSKSLFLLYKTIYEHEDWVYIEIERKFINIIETISRILFYFSKRSSFKLPIKTELRLFRKKFFLYLEEKEPERLLKILEEIKKLIKEIENNLTDTEKQLIFDIPLIDKKTQTLSILNKTVNSLENLLRSLKEDSYDILQKSFDYFIKSIFKDQLCKYDTNISKIILGSNYLEIKNNKTVNLHCSELLDKKINILFIESPFILEIFEQLGRLTQRHYLLAPKRRYEKYRLPYHIEDLINQIREFEKFLDEDTDLLKKIEEIIQGKFKYNPLKEEIYFQENSHDIPTLNTASGVLTFGVLHLLLQSGAFDENTILIFEEPETNLHPEWQVKIVEILKALMEEKGVQIFLTTHSPFIVKAVEVLALEDKNFKKNLSINLLYEDGESMCDFEESIEKIYDQLLGPFSNLMFRGWFYE